MKHGFIECPGQKIAAVSDRITIVFLEKIEKPLWYTNSGWSFGTMNGL